MAYAPLYELWSLEGDRKCMSTRGFNIDVKAKGRRSREDTGKTKSCSDIKRNLSRLK